MAEEKQRDRIDSAIRKLSILKRDFNMKGANATTMERAIDLLRSLRFHSQESPISFDEMTPVASGAGARVTVEGAGHRMPGCCAGGGGQS